MNTEKNKQIGETLDHLFKDSKYDMVKAMKGFAKGAFKPITPSNFKDVYLSISKAQGEDLVRLIKSNNIQNIVEFGTSFGISTLFLALGVLETNGSIITTELIDSKAQKAIENFESAGVSDLIEVRIGDALETLKNHEDSIDMLLLDGWKDLYLPIFKMLEPNFHENTFIYVDNANMSDTKEFLKVIGQDASYLFQTEFGGDVVIIRKKGAHNIKRVW